MKSQRKTLFGALVCAALLALTPAVRAEDLKASFKETVDKEAQVGKMAIATKQMAPLNEFYADDAILMPPNEVAYEGKEPIKLAWQAWADSGGLAGLSWWPTRLEVSGNLGMEVGEWDAKDESGNQVTSGKYLAVWRHSDAGWKMIADTWNSNDPLPTPAK